MKIRYPVIGIVAILIIANCLPIIDPTILGILLFACLGLIAYLIIRNISRAIKGAVTGTPTGDYRGEARKACEKVTPKRKQNVTPPWEE